MMDAHKKTAWDLYLASLPEHCKKSATSAYQCEQGNGYDLKSTPADSDGHTHKVYVDAYGNGFTSFDIGHFHEVRIYTVVPWQDLMQVYSHGHPGLLAQPGTDPTEA